MNRRDMLRALGLTAGVAVINPRAIAQIKKAKHDLSVLTIHREMSLDEFPDRYNRLLSVVEQIANAVDNLEVIDLHEKADLEV